MRRFRKRDGPYTRALLLLIPLLCSCGYLDEQPRLTATPRNVASTAAPASLASTPTLDRAPTRPPVSTRTPIPQPADETDVEQSVVEARKMFERVLRTAALPGIEDLLVETVALAAPSGGEQLPRAAAARWLRQRATGPIQTIDFQRHQHQALIIATTTEWAAQAPLTANQLGFTLRRYDATGAQDPEHGDWLIDVFEAD